VRANRVEKDVRYYVLKRYMSTDLENTNINRGIIMGEARTPGYGLLISDPMKLRRDLPDTDLARQQRLAGESGEPVPRLGGTLGQEMYRDSVMNPAVVLEYNPEFGVHEIFTEERFNDPEDIAEMNLKYYPGLRDLGKESMNNPEKSATYDSEEPYARDPIEHTWKRHENMARYETRVRQPDEHNVKNFSKRTMAVRRTVGSSMMKRPVGKRRIVGLRAGGGGYNFVGPLNWDGEETRNYYKEMD